MASLSARLASLRWNLRDAGEALNNAVAMQNWASARKYITQIEKLQRDLYDAERAAGTKAVYGTTREYKSDARRRGR